MIKPQGLRPGDELRIVTPASGLTPEQTADGIRLLENQGFRVTLGRHVYDRTGYLGGSDQERATDIMEAFLDPNVKGILCSRGGYGCARLFPYLDLDAMAASGKWFGGFSDLTTLHIALNQRGLVTMHCPMLITLSVPREDWVIESFLNILKGDDCIPERACRAETVIPGVAEGILTGGCMCLMCDSIATPNPLDAAGKLLLIEDVDEDPHRIDAMLTHLRNTKILDSAAGLVIGEMTGTDERRDEKIGAMPWTEIVRDRLYGLDIPTVIRYPIGHMKTMLSLPLGVRARLDADAGTLRLLEPLCAG